MLKIVFVVLIIIIGVAVGFLLAEFVSNAQSSEDQKVLEKRTISRYSYHTTVQNESTFKQNFTSMCLPAEQSTTLASNYVCSHYLVPMRSGKEPLLSAGVDRAQSDVKNLI